MATICNMGAEVGATTSIFPYGPAQARYLDATRRKEVRMACDNVADVLLRPDEGAHYDQVIEVG